MSVADTIKAKLETAFAPVRLEVLDESHRHAGHAHESGGGHEPFDGSGGTHFRVRIVAEAFAKRSRLERHRAVNDALRHELSNGVHALAIEASAPDEPGR